MAKATIVSVTPIRIRADSRSFKIAATIARFGYCSVVVEGERSDLDEAHLPFRLRSLGRTLAADGIQVDAAKVLPNRNLVRTIRKAWMAIRDRLPLFLIFPFLLRYVKRDIILPLYCIPKASLYYVHGLSFFPAVSLLCTRYRASLIYDAHDFYGGMQSPAETSRLSFSRRWIMAFYRHLESRLVDKAAAVVTVSDGVAKLEERAFGCHPIVVRNCHDARLDQEPPMNLRQVLGLSSDQFILVALGNAKEGTAIQEALDAMEELPAHVHLVFVGRYFEPIIKSIRSGHLENRVHVVPPVKPFEVVPFIWSGNASIILYYPRSANYMSSLPNRFFQPLAAELPLLYPELPEMKRIAEKYEIGIPIEPRSPVSIISGVTRLMTEPGLLERYQENLRAAKQDLAWENEEHILKKLISAILDKGSATPMALREKTIHNRRRCQHDKRWFTE